MHAQNKQIFYVRPNLETSLELRLGYLPRQTAGPQLIRLFFTSIPKSPSVVVISE
jgi:hypothetical protein